MFAFIRLPGLPGSRRAVMLVSVSAVLLTLGFAATPAQAFPSYCGGVSCAPTNVTRPQITCGDGCTGLQDGQTLTVIQGHWTSTDVYGFVLVDRLQRCWVTGPFAGKCTTATMGPTGTYTLKWGDVGAQIRVQETAVPIGPTGGHLGSVTIAFSDVYPPDTYFAAPPPPISVVAPAISCSTGDPCDTSTLGETLTASQGTWDSPDPLTFSYKWYTCIDSAGRQCIATTAGVSRLVTTRDAGTYIKVMVTAFDKEHQSTSATSNVLAPAPPPPPPPPGT